MAPEANYQVLINPAEAGLTVQAEGLTVLVQLTSPVMREQGKCAINVRVGGRAPISFAIDKWMVSGCLVIKKAQSNNVDSTKRFEKLSAYAQASIANFNCKYWTFFRPKMEVLHDPVSADMLAVS